MIEIRGLTERVTLAGELDAHDLEAAYARADVFVLATRQETYGMAVAEALAHGLPVVSTKTGAIDRLVGDRAGLLVEPGDVDGLFDALATVIRNEPLRQRLADGTRDAAERLPSWKEASARLSAALMQVINRG
jgi:glycosyltransferase involved in cell wall biosynthesis